MMQLENIPQIPASVDAPIPPRDLDVIPAPPDPAAAKVRFRLKGETEGPLYQGQALIVPCLNCARK
jgi:hypothetical protein